jgi:hypothetical protein
MRCTSGKAIPAATCARGRGDRFGLPSSPETMDARRITCFNKQAIHAPTDALHFWEGDPAGTCARGRGDRFGLQSSPETMDARRITCFNKQSAHGLTFALH